MENTVAPVTQNLLVFPCPPMPVKSPGVLLERTANKLGYNPYSAMGQSNLKLRA